MSHWRSGMLACVGELARIDDPLFDRAWPLDLPGTYPARRGSTVGPRNQELPALISRTVPVVTAAAPSTGAISTRANACRLPIRSAVPRIA